jgi:M6 family metalloprotease-like protein
MRTTGFFAGALCALSSFFSTAVHAEPNFKCAGFEAPQTQLGPAAKPLASASKKLPSRGTINVLVVFAKFKDEAPGKDQAPDFAEQLFDPDRPGSFAHFYNTMSFGQLQVQGTVLPKRYTSEQPAAAYLAKQAGQHGEHGRFALEILRQVDADIDLGPFDNDGPDGLPNSGDDDGLVDYVFINLLSTPQDFIVGGAEGFPAFGFKEYYSSADVAADGSSIQVSGMKPRGAILKEGGFSRTVGSMAHEFGHSLGLPDLYNTVFFRLADKDPANDSAGIGKWGLMGWGAHGWNGNDGPSPFSAWSLEQLGWVGLDNGRLVEIQDDVSGLTVRDLYEQGVVYKIPLRTELVMQGTIAREYLLLENRRPGSNYYNRHQPEGLLVWHSQPQGEGKGTKRFLNKVKLICADGLSQDGRYPLGKMAEAYEEGSDLDFWAHDTEYSKRHGGNLGDSTDPFDGVNYRRLDFISNPSTALKGEQPHFTELEIEMLRQKDAMVVDIRLPRWAGTIREEVHWAGDILVDGDLHIAPEGKLVIYGGTRVRFAATDRLRSGLDPARCELQVQGALKIHTSSLALYNQGLHSTAFEKVVFEGHGSGATWYGILQEKSGQVAMPEESFVLRDDRLAVQAADLQAELPTAVEASTALPMEFQLLPNYPNPFNPETTIRYALPEAAQVHLRVYNVLGQEVRTLVDGFQEVGVQTVVWDGRTGGGQNVSSGVYVYRLEVEGKYAASRRMLLAR